MSVLKLNGNNDNYNDNYNSSYKSYNHFAFILFSFMTGFICLIQKRKQNYNKGNMIVVQSG